MYRERERERDVYTYIYIYIYIYIYTYMLIGRWGWAPVFAACVGLTPSVGVRLPLWRFARGGLGHLRGPDSWLG